MSAPAKADQATESSAIPRPLVPGWTVRLVIGGALLVVVLVRLLGRLTDPPPPMHDPAHRNVATWIFTFLALAAAWLWFCFRSGYAPALRKGVIAGTLLLVVALIATFRIDDVGGDLWPTFAPRWTAPVHTQLGDIPAAASDEKIDLSATTENDFPQFLGPDRQPWLPGPELGRDWDAAPPKLVWKRPIGAGWSAFAAVNGYAVTIEQRGDEEWVSCYEIASGEPVWGHAIQARHYNVMGGLGPRSTPTIHAGRVYALGATGVLRCLDGADGSLIWQEDLLARYGVNQKEFEEMVMWGRAGSPLMVDNLVVVPAGGKKGQAKVLAAFDAETGELVWEAETINEDGQPEQIAYSSPMLATLAGRRQILIVNESTASGHDPQTGLALWSHPWPGHSNMDASASQAVPVEPDRVLLSKGYGGGAEMIRLKAAENGRLDVVTEESGEDGLWRDKKVLQTKFSNVVVHDGYLYGLTEHVLDCVELDSGERAWKQGRYGHGQILGVGDLLLVLAEDGRLALVDLNPDRFTELRSIQALEGKTWNTLCLYGNKLLVRNAQEAACYELRARSQESGVRGQESGGSGHESGDREIAN